MVAKRRLGLVGAAVVGLFALAAGVAGPALAAPPAPPGPPPPKPHAAAAPAPAKPHTATAAAPPGAPPLVPGTPCTTTAKACVDLESERAWLIKDGKVMRGPVKVASGGRGKPTPTGHSLRVYRKEKDHKSKESRIQSGPKKGQPAPMPYSVFFEDGGIAFHSGSPSVASAGCIHLNTADAIAWFNYLQIGDQVQVVKKSVELANRKKGIYGPQGPSNAAPEATKASDQEDADSDDDDSADSRDGDRDRDRDGDDRDRDRDDDDDDDDD
jgi:lipoprotein-anchoring transpeptidase ErfK/SrfK